MCLDILIREKSNGAKGVLDLMQKLSKEYGINKPFEDDKLFDKITELTYPEVGEFLKKHVSGSTPIDYDTYFAKVGVKSSVEKKPAPIFLKGQDPYINVLPETGEIIVIPDIELNEFFTGLGLKGRDLILEVNEVKYVLDNIYDLLDESAKWKENDPITLKIKRDGKVETIKGNVKLPYLEAQIYKATDASKGELKNAWLKK